MKIGRNWLFSTGAVGVALYACYVFVGYVSIKALPTTLLIDASLYPQNLAKHWVLMPFKRQLAQYSLYSKTPTQVQEDFRRYGYTLYSGVIGYRDVTIPRNTPRPAAEVRMIRDIASFVYRSGVGIDWVDQAGCSAIHQALIESDLSSVRYLQELGGKISTSSNPTASYRLCRLDTATLAAEKGLSLN